MYRDVAQSLGEDAHASIARIQAVQHSALEDHASGLREEFSELRYLAAQAYSDSTFVIGLSGIDEENYSHARCIVALARLAVHRQWLFLQIGRLSRGGLATGYLYAHSGFAVGLPVSHAVGIESSVAKHPVVMLSEPAEIFIRNFLYTEDSKLSDTNRKLREAIWSKCIFVYDERGKMIVNPYFGAIPTDRAAPLDENQHSLLQSAYFTIRGGIELNALTPEIYDKYAYARDLHNANLHRHDFAGEYYLPVPASEKSKKFHRVDRFLEKVVDDISSGHLKDG